MAASYRGSTVSFNRNIILHVWRVLQKRLYRQYLLRSKSVPISHKIQEARQNMPEPNLGRTGTHSWITESEPKKSPLNIRSTKTLRSHQQTCIWWLPFNSNGYNENYNQIIKRQLNQTVSEFLVRRQLSMMLILTRNLSYLIVNLLLKYFPTSHLAADSPQISTTLFDSQHHKTRLEYKQTSRFTGMGIDPFQLRKKEDHNKQETFTEVGRNSRSASSN